MVKPVQNSHARAVKVTRLLTDGKGVAAILSVGLGGSGSHCKQ